MSSTIYFQIAEGVLSFMNFLYIISCLYAKKDQRMAFLFTLVTLSL